MRALLVLALALLGACADSHMRDTYCPRVHRDDECRCVTDSGTCHRPDGSTVTE